MTITLNINQIKRYLPHRYPFLFVDIVDDVVIGESIRARKSVTGNEDFFNGHFPGNPVVPGVIQIEAMGQAGALLAILSGAKASATRAIYVATIDDCKFRRPIVPGDVMDLRAKVLRTRLGMWKLGCEVYVRDQLASSATISATTGPRVTDAALPEGLPPGMFGDE
jgi:3-hydroxyacyl-[acyl-carrier-protein] dehydratase